MAFCVPTDCYFFWISKLSSWPEKENMSWRVADFLSRYRFYSTAVNHLLHLFCQHFSSVVPAMILSTDVEQIYKKVKITFQVADSHCWEITQLKWKIIRLLTQKEKQTLTGIGVWQEGIGCQNWGEKNQPDVWRNKEYYYY